MDYPKDIQPPLNIFGLQHGYSERYYYRDLMYKGYWINGWRDGYWEWWGGRTKVFELV